MNPVYHQTKFINSSPRFEDAPQDRGREIAFAGRSNSGKSSAINALTGQNTLARISKMPGRTQMLNFFEVDEEQRFVDLPGYGYARVPDSVKRKWHNLMESYLTNRRSLCAIVLVMDIRHPMTGFDWQMINWCDHKGLPIHILLTKSDKLNYGSAKNTLMQVQKQLTTLNIRLTAQVFSALKKTGVDEVHDALDQLFGARRQAEL